MFPENEEGRIDPSDEVHIEGPEIKEEHVEQEILENPVMYEEENIDKYFLAAVNNELPGQDIIEPSVPKVHKETPKLKGRYDFQII